MYEYNHLLYDDVNADECDARSIDNINYSYIIKLMIYI